MYTSVIASFSLFPRVKYYTDYVGDLNYLVHICNESDFDSFSTIIGLLGIAGLEVYTCGEEILEGYTSYLVC